MKLEKNNLVSEKHKLFCAKDSKSETYGPIMTSKTTGLFLRQVSEVLNEGQSIWAKHPQDFTLFEVGEYLPESGDVIMYDAKKSLGLVQDLKSN